MLCDTFIPLGLVIVTTGVGLPDAVHSIVTFPVSFAFRGVISNLSNVAGTVNHKKYIKSFELGRYTTVIFPRGLKSHK